MVFKFKNIFILFSLMICFSCSDHAEKPVKKLSSGDSTKSNPDKSLMDYKREMRYFDQPDTQFVCYYEMGEKYISDTVTENDRKIWRDEMIRNIQNEGINRYDVFSGNGGGPAGGEWNTDANLFCILVIRKYNLELAPFTVKLNGQTFNTTIKIFSNPDSSGKPSTIVCFTVPSKEWKKKLKPVAKKDYKTVYDPETIENLPGQLNANKFVKISLTTGRGNFSHTYHGFVKIAYGE